MRASGAIRTPQRSWRDVRSRRLSGSASARRCSSARGCHLQPHHRRELCGGRAGRSAPEQSSEIAHHLHWRDEHAPWDAPPPQHDAVEHVSKPSLVPTSPARDLWPAAPAGQVDGRPDAIAGVHVDGPGAATLRARTAVHLRDLRAHGVLGDLTTRRGERPLTRTGRIAIPALTVAHAAEEDRAAAVVAPCHVAPHPCRKRDPAFPSQTRHTRGEQHW